MPPGIRGGKASGAKGGGKGGGNGNPCKYFLSPKGCKFGSKCKYPHSMNELSKAERFVFELWVRGTSRQGLQGG